MPSTISPRQQARSLSSHRPSRTSHGEVTVVRSYRDPKLNRKSLAEAYTVPVTGREQWWRQTMKETPNPGSYDIADFVDDISQRPNTYNFKSDGRKRDANPHGKGTMLMPGAYEHHDLLYNLNRTNKTYSFKAIKRQPIDIIKFGLRKDVNINVSPNAYNTEDYLGISTEESPTRQWFFKSASQRLPTLNFKPRVPGPGTYEKTFQSGAIARPLAQMGRHHGLFFTSAFT